MSEFNRVIKSSVGKDLERMVEPLAHYICATDQPTSVLRLALTVLLREVEATNRAATTHFQTYSANGLAWNTGPTDSALVFRHPSIGHMPGVQSMLPRAFASARH